MEWIVAESNWSQFRDEVQSNWRMLTDGHLDVIAGKRMRLASKIQEAYGITSDEAERQIRSFEARNAQPRPTSLR